MDNEVRDNRKIPGIKRPYFVLPEEIPDDFRCIKIQIPDGDEYYNQLVSILKMLTLWYNFMRDETHRGKVIADLWRDALLIPGLGCFMDCEELTACLQPFFDAINEQLEVMQANVTELVERAAAGRARPSPEIENADDMAIYAGALALVQKMHKNNLLYYAEAEESLVDNASEATGLVLDLIPSGEGLPYGVALGIGNMYFTNVAATYAAAYDSMEIEAACRLYWKIKNNADTLTIAVWGDWLNVLDVNIPENAAASVFAAYSPLRQTFLNQIAEFFNGEQSLQEYFDDLFHIYYAGSQNPLTVPDDCGENIAEQVGILIDCGQGLQAEYLFADGVPFEVSAVQQTGDDNWIISLKLPAGNWNIEVTGTTGTIGQGSLIAGETAWAYHDTTGMFNNETFGGGGLASNFGDHDTTFAVFNTWCSTQAWNIMLNNAFQFTATIIVTAI